MPLVSSMSEAPSSSLKFHIRQFTGFGVTLKLVLAMTLMVTLACAATVWFVELQVRRTYHRFCAQQFDNQRQQFLEEEANRLAAAQAMLQEAVSKAPIDLLIKKNDFAGFSAGLAKVLIEVLSAHGFKPGGLARNEPFFGWISPDRVLYKPVITDAGYAMEVQPSTLEHELDPLTHGPGDRMAYLILPREAGPVLYQLIAAPFAGEGTVVDSGDLVLGIPLSHINELFGAEGKGPKAGVVLSTQLGQGQTLPVKGLMEVQGILKALPAEQGDVSLIGSQGYVQVGADDALYYQKLPAFAGMPSLYQLALFSLEDLHTFRRNIRIAVLSVIPLVPLSGLLLSIMASRRMTRPIRRLAEANERVREGDLTVHVPVDRDDELGQLSHSFNQMVEGLALKERYRSILSQVTDEEVAQRLLEGEIELGGEERNVSVLFCDIRGFTHLAEGMPPAQLIRLLNEHMSALADVAHAHHGVVDKFIGDAIMVIFGSPRSYGNDAHNAAQAALAMQAKRIHLNQVTEVPFEIGIGVASGKVIAGCVGSSERMNYTVVGNRVNLASRLCSKSAAGEILIDESTRARLGAAASIEALPPMPLKGMAEPVAVFRLQGLI